MGRRLELLAIALVCALALVPGVVAAQTAPATITYDPAFFAAAKPESAYDMVLLLPGFAFDPGDQDSRGLASAAGNVLIDGRRPAAKTDSLANILRRIPASGVTRIELIRNSSSRRSTVDPVPVSSVQLSLRAP